LGTDASATQGVAMARTVSRSPCHRLLVGLSCKLLCFFVVATCGNTSNEITWSHGPQIAMQNRFKLRTAAMSIVGSLLSQLRSKLGARFSRHVGVKRIFAACTLIRFPDLMAILQIRTPHLPMSLRCGEKNLRSSRTHLFVSFSPNSVFAIHQTGNKPKTSTI